jgi:hypothetical protein
MEFQVIGVAEDIGDGAARDIQGQLRVLTKPEAKDGVLQVLPGLSEGLDGEAPGHGAVAEALDLRKDEPHQMGFFSSIGEFGYYGVENSRLSCQKMFQRVIHGGHSHEWPWLQ